MPLDVYIGRLDVIVTAKPLTPSVFAPFGEVIQNPYLKGNGNSKSGSAWSTLRGKQTKDKNLPPYAHDAVSANQGTAIKYKHVARPRNLYAQAPSRRPADLVVNMFVCSSRALSDTRFPPDPPSSSGSSGSASKSSSSGDPQAVSRRSTLRSGSGSGSDAQQQQQQRQQQVGVQKSGPTEDPTAAHASSSDGGGGGQGGAGEAANKKPDSEDPDRPAATSASASRPPNPPEPLLSSPSYFFNVSVLERHPFTTQTFIPLTSASSQYLVIVCPSRPPSRQDQTLPVPYVGADLPGSGFPRLSRAEAFVANAGQAVTYGAGTWHAPMVALGAEGETVDFVTVQFANEVAREDCQEVVFSSADEKKFGVSVEVPAALFAGGGVTKAKL
jgi:ureidoglycolate hydrolase